MEFDEMNRINDIPQSESIDLRNLFENYASYFKWFVVSILLFAVLGFLKVRYETPMYGVNASILIKELDKGNSLSNLSGFEDLGLFSSGENTLENEMEFLRSRRLMVEVVKELNLNVRYFIEGSPIDREMYPDFPVVFNFVDNNEQIDQINSKVYVEVVSSDRYELFDFNQESLGIKEFDQIYKVNLFNDDESHIRNIKISRNENFSNDIQGRTIEILIQPVTATADNINLRLTIEPVSERYSKVLKLSLQEPVVSKGVAILNNLIDQYNLDGINDKDELAQATTSFLDDRLILLANELEAIEASAAQFKTNRAFLGSDDGADIYLESSTIAENEMVNANTQLELVNYMLEEINRSNSGELLPSNIGLSDRSIINWISDYNELVLKKNRILKSSSELNPIVVNIDSQIDVIRNNLIASLKSMQSSSQIEISALTKRSGKISSKIASVPKYEKEYKNIIRGQETKNTLYLFLLQKREESILSNAVRVEKAKIIDPAYSNGEIVSPKKLLVYLGSLFLGLFIPFIIIYTKNLLDTKVRDENDLKNLGIPYLGDIPRIKSSKNKFIRETDNSNLAEAFRYLRTNINFILQDKSDCKTVFITSTESGEGKTFISINLGNSLAISGKKTLVLAMDLRAPKIKKYLEIEDKKLGVSNFVKNASIGFNDIVNTSTGFEKLHIIDSGDIPPNPVELLMDPRIEEIFEEAKSRYDYIIVDSAPVGMVTDTIQIASKADLTLYVVKADNLDKRLLHIPENLNKQRKLKSMSFIINGSDHAKGGYGYGYSYSYGKERKKSLFRKLLNKVTYTSAAV